uniref:Uncharacterized protein n=1 Tax=Schistocephalus solidus TaxID=70667 RepID=A0A0V0J492_SCHSO
MSASKTPIFKSFTRTHPKSLVLANPYPTLPLQMEFKFSYPIVWVKTLSQINEFLHFVTTCLCIALNSVALCTHENHLGRCPMPYGDQSKNYLKSSLWCPLTSQ